MAALFDCYLIVDWSAANVPTRGKDSIWLALHNGEAITRLENPPTRHAAMAMITSICAQAIAYNKRMLVGFDFAFGWPSGSVRALVGKACVQGIAPWKALWSYLAANIQDDESNANNSFELAGNLNLSAGANGPFWGHPHQHANRYLGLGPKKPNAANANEFRQVERVARGAKSVWQLAYNGAVGRQSLIGIAHLQKLRAAFADDLAVWPFETHFAQTFDKPITIAEIYPSLFDVKASAKEVLDQAQVRTVAEQFCAFDQAGTFEQLLAAPSDLDANIVAEIICEEGWIVGAGAIL